MSEPSTASRSSDAMSALEFQTELRRVARFDVPRAIEHPLTAALNSIEQNPAFAQSRLLTRILTALTYDRGDFRRAEASVLDTPTLTLVIALIDAYRAGTTKREDWIDAVSKAQAAEDRAGA